MIIIILKIIFKMKLKNALFCFIAEKFEKLDIIQECLQFSFSSPHSAGGLGSRRRTPTGGLFQTGLPNPTPIVFVDCHRQRTFSPTGHLVCCYLTTTMSENRCPHCPPPRIEVANDFTLDGQLGDYLDWLE